MKKSAISPARRQWDLSLKPNWLINSVFCVVGVVIASVASEWLFGTLSVDIDLALVSAVVVGILFVAGSLLLFRHFITEKWWAALVILLPAIVLIIALWANYLLDSLTPSFVVNSVLLLYAWYALSIAVIYFLAIIIDIILFTLTNKLHWTLTLIACLILTGSYIVVLPVVISNYHNEHNQQQHLKDLQNMSFSVYKPTYIPKGYSEHSSDLNTTSVSPWPQAAYYTTDYFVGNNDVGAPSPYTINEFAVPSTYNPPTDCGGVEPDLGTHEIQPCELIGTTTSGGSIYYLTSGESFGSDIVAYYKLGQTLITLGTSDGTSVQKADIITIFDSLQPSTGMQLQKSPAQ